jgi:hypothetical protein
MRTEFFEKYPTSLRLEMFTVVNEGFQRWDPATRSAEAKAFLVITAEDLSDGAFTTQLVGLSLNGLKRQRCGVVSEAGDCVSRSSREG